jgi:gas vesicle protein
MNKKRNGFGSFFAGFLIGGFAGSFIALVTAPQAGQKTRDQLRTKSVELKDKTEQTVDEALTTIKQASDEVSKQVAVLQAHHKDVFDESQSLWKHSIEEIARITKDAVEEIKATTTKPAGEIPVPDSVMIVTKPEIDQE